MPIESTDPNKATLVAGILSIRKKFFSTRMRKAFFFLRHFVGNQQRDREQMPVARLSGFFDLMNLILIGDKINRRCTIRMPLSMSCMSKDSPQAAPAMSTSPSAEPMPAGSREFP